MDETGQQHRQGDDMEPVRITTEEVQEAWRLFTVALDSLPADTPPDVVNRVVGLVLATRSRNDVAAMHNMIVVNLATFTEKIDALIVATQNFIINNAELREDVKDMKELVAAFGEAYFEEDSVRMA